MATFSITVEESKRPLSTLPVTFTTQRLDGTFYFIFDSIIPQEAETYPTDSVSPETIFHPVYQPVNDINQLDIDEIRIIGAGVTLGNGASGTLLLKNGVGTDISGSLPYSYTVGGSDFIQLGINNHFPGSTDTYIVASIQFYSGGNLVAICTWTITVPGTQ